MNKQRRKRLGDVFSIITQAKDILEGIRDEEQDSLDNLPESFRNGERGEEMQGHIDMLEEAYEHLEEAYSAIEEI